MSDDQTRTILDAAAEHLPESTIDQLDAANYPTLYATLTRPGDAWRFEDLEKFAPQPARIRQSPTFETPGAFADYVKAFGAPSTRLFASLKVLRVRGVIDYHLPDDPSWHTHVAEYPAKFAPAFAAWHAAHGQKMPQKAFAEFLEDRAEDAIQPDAADLMEVAQKFEAARNVEFKSAINVSTGERQFKYEEKDSVGGAIACPKVIVLRTAVFQGCEPVQWGARLAYDISDGKLYFTVKIHRLQELLEAEFMHLCDGIMVDLPDVPLHRGAID